MATVEEITAQDGRVYVEEHDDELVRLWVYQKGHDYTQVDLNVEQATKVVKALQRAVLLLRVRRVGQ